MTQWGAPRVLLGAGGPGTEQNKFPAAAKGMNGRIIAVVHRSAPETDTAVFDAIASDDDGVTWATPVPLSLQRDVTAQDDAQPCIETDGRGTWIAAFHSLIETAGARLRSRCVLVRSTDNGDTWHPPEVMSEERLGSKGVYQYWPLVKSDGAGTWIATWEEHGPPDYRYEVHVARSTDAGATWSDPVLPAEDGLSLRGDNHAGTLATDGQGNWLVVWHSTLHGGRTVVPGTRAVWASASGDDGITWSPMRLVGNDIRNAFDVGCRPQVAYAGNGRWLVLTHALDEAVGAPRDAKIVWTESRDRGRTWRDWKRITRSAESPDGYSETYPRLFALKDRYVAFWDWRGPANGPTGSDIDEAVSELPIDGARWSRPHLLNGTGFADGNLEDTSASLLPPNNGATPVVLWARRDPVLKLSELCVARPKSALDWSENP